MYGSSYGKFSAHYLPGIKTVASSHNLKRNTSIKLKAGFLLTVFGLNTVIGFACSVGMNMGFNSGHHQEANTSAPVVHIHADGKRHVHDAKKQGQRDEKPQPGNEAGKAVVHFHKDGKQHIHDREKDTRSHNALPGNANRETPVHIHKDGKRHVHNEKAESQGDDRSALTVEKKVHQEQKRPEENCCTDEVRDFEQLDKSVPQPVKIVHPIFFTAFVGTYYDISLLPLEDVVKDIKQFVRSYHPPIPDIRIAIQSFQI